MPKQYRVLAKKGNGGKYRKGKYTYQLFKGVVVARKRKGKNYAQSLLASGNWQKDACLRETDIRIFIDLLDLEDIESVIKHKDAFNSFTKAERMLNVLRGYPCSERKGTT